MAGQMEQGGSGLPVAALLKFVGSHSLAQRVQAADTNRDGELSREEVLQVFVNERTARRSAKRMVWALLAALALLLVVLAANAGLTFAVLTLSKDTKIEQNVLVAKDSGRAIQTGLALAPHQLMDMLWLTPNNGTVYAIQLPLQGGEPGFVWHQWVHADGGNMQKGQGQRMIHSDSTRHGASAHAGCQHRPHISAGCQHRPHISLKSAGRPSANPPLWPVQVAGVEVRRGARTTVYTMAGAVLTVTPQGITFSSTALPGGASVAGAATPGPGRRLAGSPTWDVPIDEAVGVIGASGGRMYDEPANAGDGGSGGDGGSAYLL